MMMPEEFTSRGFAIYKRFADTYGNEVRIQESSSATNNCVWVICKNEKGNDSSPHLNVEQAKLLIEGLQEFINEHESQ
jgi:hypothetical protein